MKKFIFGFILCFLGLFIVNASELELNSLGYSSCLDSEEQLSYYCVLNNSGVSVSVTSRNSRVSNYFLVSDSFTLIREDGSSNSIICFYTSDYSFVSCMNNVAITSDGTEISKPNNSFYARIFLWDPSSNIYVIFDDLNSVSALNGAINSLSHTVGQTLTIITTNTILLIATAIFIIGICLYLIWRIVRGG